MGVPIKCLSWISGELVINFDWLCVFVFVVHCPKEPKESTCPVVLPLPLTAHIASFDFACRDNWRNSALAKRSKFPTCCCVSVTAATKHIPHNRCPLPVTHSPKCPTQFIIQLNWPQSRISNWQSCLAVRSSEFVDIFGPGQARRSQRCFAWSFKVARGKSFNVVLSLPSIILSINATEQSRAVPTLQTRHLTVESSHAIPISSSIAIAIYIDILCSVNLAFDLCSGLKANWCERKANWTPFFRVPLGEWEVLSAVACCCCTYVLPAWWLKRFLDRKAQKCRAHAPKKHTHSKS